MMFIVYFNAFCSTDIDRGTMKYYFIILFFRVFQAVSVHLVLLDKEGKR